MAYQSEIENKKTTIRLMGFIIICLIGVNVYFGHKLVQKAEIPFVDIPSHTLSGKAERLIPGVMKKTSVYDFTLRIFQSLHRWSYDGSIEYEKNIRRFESVLTPSYMSFLRRDYKRRLGNNIKSELKGRTRLMLPLATAWDADRVQVVATQNGKPSAWVVFLDMELQEFHLGQQVKNRYIRYPIRVSLFDSDRINNPSMLALDGYEEEPKTITKDLELKIGAK